MNFPLFLIVPALRLIGGIVQSLTQGQPADAPGSVIGGGSPTVEFQPMLQQLLGAQMMAEAAGQTQPPTAPFSAGNFISPHASGDSTLIPPHSAASGDARIAPTVEMGTPFGAMMDIRTLGVPSGSPSTPPEFVGLVGSGASTPVVPHSAFDPALMISRPAPVAQVFGDPPLPGAAPSGVPGDTGLIDSPQPLGFTVGPLSAHGARSSIEALNRAGWASSGLEMTEEGQVGRLTEGPQRESFTMRSDGIVNFGLSASRSHTEAPATVAAAAAPASVPELPRLADQLAHSVRVNWESGRSEARLALVPPDLGTVRVQVVMDHSSLSLTFTAGSEQTRGLIESSLSGLREKLAGQGIDVGQMNVQVDLTERDSGRSFSAFDLHDSLPEAPRRLETAFLAPAPRPIPALATLDLFA
jgi:hypothetical protein